MSTVNASLNGPTVDRKTKADWSDDSIEIALAGSDAYAFSIGPDQSLQAGSEVDP